MNPTTPQDPPKQPASDTPINLPVYEPICGIITSGLCATPEEQAYFDEHIAGHPPQSE